jgi:predicted anti-sigma-YlaC factor YlaD
MSRSNGLLRILSLRCEAASELASRELDEPLPGLERVALWGHLLACRSCRRFRRQIRLIRESLRRRDHRPAPEGPDDGVLSEAARRRIAHAIAEAMRDEAGDTDRDRAPD